MFIWIDICPLTCPHFTTIVLYISRPRAGIPLEWCWGWTSGHIGRQLTQMFRDVIIKGEQRRWDILEGAMWRGNLWHNADDNSDLRSSTEHNAKQCIVIEQCIRWQSSLYTFRGYEMGSLRHSSPSSLNICARNLAVNSLIVGGYTITLK